MVIYITPSFWNVLPCHNDPYCFHLVPLFYTTGTLSLKTVFISIQGCSKTTFLEKEAQESTQSQTRPIHVPLLPYGGVDNVETCAEGNSALPFPDKVQGNASDIEPSCTTWPAKDEHKENGWKGMSHMQIWNYSYNNLGCLYKRVFAWNKRVKRRLSCLTS